MIPFTEIGEMLISDADRDYFFRPSFANMSRIGSPAAIVERFAELHTSDAPRLLEAAMEAYGTILRGYLNTSMHPHSVAMPSMPE